MLAAPPSAFFLKALYECPSILIAETLFADVIGQADGKARRRDQKGRLGGARIGNLVALRIHEALGGEEVVGLVEVAHAYANCREVLGHVVGRLGMTTLEPKLLEELNDRREALWCSTSGLLM